MGCGGGEIWVAYAPKNAQSMIGGESAVEGEEGGAHV
jgi:hypothetical protein